MAKPNGPRTKKPGARSSRRRALSDLRGAAHRPLLEGQARQACPPAVLLRTAKTIHRTDAPYRKTDPKLMRGIPPGSLAERAACRLLPQCEFLGESSWVNHDIDRLDNLFTLLVQSRLHGEIKEVRPCPINNDTLSWDRRAYSARNHSARGIGLFYPRGAVTATSRITKPLYSGE